MSNNINESGLIFNGLVKANDPLVMLKNKLNFEKIKNECINKKTTSTRGRKGYGLDFHIAAHILKYTYNLSDDRLAEDIAQKPVFQYFCGFPSFDPNLKINPTTFSKFRKRFGADNFDIIFRESIIINGPKAIEKNVIQDTTVENKDISFPTDTNLILDIYEMIIKIKYATGIRLRDLYSNDIAELKRTIRFGYNKKSVDKCNKAKIKLKTTVKKLLRDLERSLQRAGYYEEYKDSIELFGKVLNQTRDSKNKIYSLEEQDVYCVAKGKVNCKYEYGFKVGIAIGEENTVILGNICCKENIHDSKIAPQVLDHVESMVGVRPENSYQDRGFRGAEDPKGTIMHFPDNPCLKDSPEIVASKIYHFKRRSAIEAVISNLKRFHGLGRDYLKGYYGSNINLKSACIGYNVSKFLSSCKKII